MVPTDTSTVPRHSGRVGSMYPERPNTLIFWASEPAPNSLTRRAEIQLLEFVSAQRRSTIWPTRERLELRGAQFPKTGCVLEYIEQGVLSCSRASVYRNGLAVEPIWRFPRDTMSYWKWEKSGPPTYALTYPVTGSMLISPVRRIVFMYISES